MKNKTIEMKFKDIHDYILSDTETHYSTEQALDSLYNRKLTWDKLNLLREYIDVNKLLNDHKWYLDYKEQMEKNLIQGIGLLLKKDKELNSQSKMIDSRHKKQMEKHLIKGIGLLLEKDQKLHRQSKMIDLRYENDIKKI